MKPIMVELITGLSVTKVPQLGAGAGRGGCCGVLGGRGFAALT